MIKNESESVVAERLEACCRAVPGAAPLLDALRNRPEPFEFRVNASGWEFAALEPVDGRPNRAVLKVFVIPDGKRKGQAAVFFYKTSHVPFSRDRFSYGVCMIPETNLAEEEAVEWIRFATTGFHPEAQPHRLRRAFTFNVPE